MAIFKLNDEEKKLRESVKPKYKSIIIFFIPILSGCTMWVRVFYNMLIGVSFKECIRQEKIDIWNIGMKYRLKIN